MILSVFINLAFAESNDVVVIEKPKWCNSANLSYYYTLEEFQEEYKYPCATYMQKSVTSHVGKSFEVTYTSSNCLEHFYE